jgi:hypothetical protein
MIAVGVLAICCELTLVPEGYGQSNQNERQTNNDTKSLTGNNAPVQPVSPPSPADEATVYVYRTGKTFGAALHARIFIGGDHQAILHLSNYLEAKVPQGKVFVAGTPSGNLASVPECAGPDIQLAFVSGAPGEAQREDLTRCEGALREAIAAISADLRSNYPSTEVIHLCNLKVSAGMPWGYIHTVGYRREDAIKCQFEMRIFLRLLKGSLTWPTRIAIDVEAGKTYYIMWSYTMRGGKLELMDSTTGAKDILKCHPANDQ